MLYGAVLKKIRRQIESLIRDQLDATTSSLQRIPNEPSFVVSCPSGCEKFSYKRSEKHSVRPTCKIRDTVRKGAVRHDWIKIHFVDDARFTGRMTYTREGHIASIVELALAQLRVTFTMHTRQHVQHHRIVMVGSQITCQTMITTQQLDLATRMVLEQILLLSNGNYKQSTIHQLPLRCVDGRVKHRFCLNP